MASASGELPNGAPGNGCTAMVFATRRAPVSITEMVSALVLATNRSSPCSSRAVGWRPTPIDATSRPAARSTTEMAPVAAPPDAGSATIAVPEESLVTSPGAAGRPPWSLTYAMRPDTATECGALPTGISRTAAPPARSTTPSVLSRQRATYSVAIVRDGEATGIRIAPPGRQPDPSGDRDRAVGGDRHDQDAAAGLRRVEAGAARPGDAPLRRNAPVPRRQPPPDGGGGGGRRHGRPPRGAQSRRP